MKTLIAVGLIALSMAGTASAEGLREYDKRDRLDAARMLLFDRNWPKAVAELRRVVADKKEPLRDEASLWLAHSLFQMGNAPEALRVIDMLEADYPRSTWVLLAKSLRVEIATKMGRSDVLWSFAVPTPAPPAPPRTSNTPRLAPTPAPPRTGPVPATPGPRTPAAPRAPTVALTMVDVQIEALSGLMRREPDRAVPVLREIVVQELETPQARRALFVLGLSTHAGARETVMHFAQSGPDTLRVVAVEQLARWPSTPSRRALAAAYGSGSGSVKVAVLRSLTEARGDHELIAIARHESDPELRAYAISQLRALDTPAARNYLKTLR